MLAIVCALQGPASAWAWNETGHMTVALIAWRRLSDEQRKQIGEILKAHPHYQQLLLAGKPADVDESEWAFLRAAFWPDLVRPAADKPEDVTKYHHGNWHYATIPFILPKDKDTYDATQIKPNDESLLTAVPQCVAKLSRADTAAADRAVALCWILHLVGDVHQPLHAVSLFSNDYKLGDMGGNSLAVRNHGVPIRLHAFWDDLLGTPNTYMAIDQLALTIMAAPVHDPDKMPEIKKHATLASWHVESHEYAVAFAYLNGHLKSANWRAFENHEIQKDDIPELPQGYEANARELAGRRIALAGYRLADLLSQALH